MPEIPSVSIHELQRRIASGEPITLVDVRTPEEYEKLHAEGALLIPLSDLSAATLQEKLKRHQCPPGGPIYVLCHSGRRAMSACEQIFEHLPNVVHVQGGTLAWAQEGLPLESGPEEEPC